MRTRRLRAAICVLGGLLAAAGAVAENAEVVVNDASDTLHSSGCAVSGTGTCSLRDAITFAGQWDRISFAIPGPGVHTITLNSDLPSTAGGVAIDGYTQPGSSPNTNGPGLADNAVLLIEINGNGKGCLVLGGSTNNVQGLVINRCGGYAITSTIPPQEIGVNFDGIVGNFIGTDPTGTLPRPNGGGVFGGDVGMPFEPKNRNVISGNEGYGVSGSRRIVGNFIGLDATGTRPLPNGAGGVAIDVRLGAATPDDPAVCYANVVSGNLGAGVVFKPEGPYSQPPAVNSNFIGTDVTGTVAVPNGGSGIEIGDVATDGSVNIVNAYVRDNLVSGNAGRGIVLVDTSAEVSGNLIGTDISGTLPLGNVSTGLWIRDSGAADSWVSGNTIAFNGAGDPVGGGIVVDGSSEHQDTAILGNSIFGNTSDGSSADRGLGIDRQGPGPSPNDHCAIGSDGERAQNFPVLASAQADAAGIRIRGALDAQYHPPSQLVIYRIEFFASPTCDPSGYGEGQTFLGLTELTPDANCNAPFDVSLPIPVPVGQTVTATASEYPRDPPYWSYRTSEFSACVPVEPGSSTVVFISGFSPGCGSVGADIVVTGGGFDGVTALAVGGVNASFRVDSPAQITATVPAGAATGPISVTTASGTVVSSSAFTVAGTPAITGFSPASGWVGSTVVITGTNFTCASSVTFNGTPADFTLDSATQITAKVPSGATSGHIALTTPGGSALSAATFTVVAAPPTISGFTPTSGSVGTSVVITGTNLGSASAASFNGVSTTVTVNSPTQVTAHVPFGATTGPIALTTPGGTVTGSGVFTVNDVVNGLVIQGATVVSRNTTPVPGGQSGTITIRATFTNTSPYPIRAPFFVVTQLSGGNLLLNADGGPAGAGARLTPDVGPDGILSPAEAFTTSFVVGVQSGNFFWFFVDLRGEPLP